MTDNRLATVGDLIAVLQNCNPASPVRWISTTLEYATYTVDEVRVATAHADQHDKTAREVVWLCEGDEAGHLPRSVMDAWDW